MELIEKVLIKASAWKKNIYMTSALFSGDGADTYPITNSDIEFIAEL